MSEEVKIDFSDPNLKSVDPVTGQTLDEIRREGTYEEEPKFSDVAIDFAEKAHKQAVEDPASMKIENQSAMDQVEFASRFFQMYNSVFRNMINKMNKKAAARVITNLIAYPLETGNIKWQSKEEKDAFFIGNQLLETKYMLFKYVAMNEAEKAKLAQEPKKEEVKTEGITHVETGIIGELK